MAETAASERARADTIENDLGSAADAVITRLASQSGTGNPY